jgi:large subunit ribosomal protein L13Ae
MSRRLVSHNSVSPILIFLLILSLLYLCLFLSLSFSSSSSQVFEGIPAPFNRLKRQVIPFALRNLRLRPGRKYCRLGDLASEMGWKHSNLVARLEDKRKVASKAFYHTKKQLNKLRAQAAKNVAGKITNHVAALAKLGY